MNGQADRWRDGWTDGRADGRIDGCNAKLANATRNDMGPGFAIIEFPRSKVRGLAVEPGKSKSSWSCISRSYCA